MTKQKSQRKKKSSLNANEVVHGDKITVGNIGPGTIAAIGRGAQAKVTNEMPGADLEKLFDLIYKKIDSLPDEATVPKEDVKEAAEMIEGQIRQGDHADQKALQFNLKALKHMAPDIWEVVVDTFSSPLKGVATIIRKVMEKAKSKDLSE